MRQRAGEVLPMGTYIGLFEWLVWGCINKVPVLMLFARNLVDIVEVFGPGLCFLDPGARPCYVVTCFMRDDMMLPPCTEGGLHPQVNHYVAGVPLPRGPSETVSLEYVDASIKKIEGTGKKQSLRALAALAGLAVHPVRADGNCGIAVMCGYHKEPDTMARMAKVRVAISEFIASVADVVSWQDAFVACDEYLPRYAVAAAGTCGDDSRARSLPKAVAGALGRLCGKMAPPLFRSSSLTADSPPKPASAMAPAPEKGEPAPATPLASAIVPLDGSPVKEKAPLVSCGDNPRAFSEYLSTLDSKALEKICVSHESFYSAERAWLAAHPRTEVAFEFLRSSRQNVSTTLRHRLAVGEAFLRWRSGSAGRTSSRQLHDFLARVYFPAPSDGDSAQAERAPAFAQASAMSRHQITKKDKVWLARCVKLAKEQQQGMNPGEFGAPRGCPLAGGTGRASAAKLCRKRTTQGRPRKAAFLRQELFEWFLVLRASVAGRIPPKFVLAQASAMATEIVRKMQKSEKFVSIPKIDRLWLIRWQYEYNICFRKPTNIYKCSYHMLVERCTALWKNLYYVRALAMVLWERRVAIFGLDQTPLQMNEAGSRNTRTLALKGAPEVCLKENCSATRQRLSVLTCVSDDAAAASQPGGLPWQCCFKGQTKRTIRHVKASAEHNVGIDFSPKGSYRLENMLGFLRGALEEWTEERASANDWKILLLDSYRVHFHESIRDLCWARGYIVLFHYGGTTGVTQVNDVGLHAPFKRHYCELEAAAFLHRALVDPADISRTRDEVAHRIFCLW